MANETEKQQKPDGKTVAVVMMACIAQIQADAETHQDADARERLLNCADRFTEIVSGKMSDGLREHLKRASQALMDIEQSIAA